jgi:hypothetical protein
VSFSQSTDVQGEIDANIGAGKERTQRHTVVAKAGETKKYCTSLAFDVSIAWESYRLLVSGKAWEGPCNGVSLEGTC